MITFRKAGLAALACVLGISQQAAAAPQVGNALSRDHTLAVAGAQIPAFLKLAQEVLAALSTIKDPQLQMLAQPATRQMMLGTDPLTDAGLRQIGLDPAGEAAMVFDKRLGSFGHDVVVLLPIADRAKLLGFIEQRGGKKAKVETKGGVEWITFSERDRFLVGKRGPFTAVLRYPSYRQEPELEKGFEAFVKGGGSSLGASNDWQKALTSDASAIFGYATMGALLHKPRHEQRRAFYGQRFPAFAGQIGPSLEAVRLVATPEGRALLAKMVQHDRPAHLSRRVPAKGWGALRGSVNLASLFDGVAAFLGPDMPMTAAQMKAQLLQRSCVDWSMIEAAFDGHAIVAADVADLAKSGSNQIPTEKVQWFAALGVKDGKALEALLASVSKGCPANGMPKAQVVKVGQQTAYTTAPVTYARASSGDVLLVSTNKQTVALANKIQAGKSLESSPAGRLLDSAVAGASAVDLMPAIEVAQAKSARPLPKPALDELARYGMILTRLVLDGDGARWSVEPPDALMRQVRAFVGAAAMAATMMRGGRGQQPTY